MPVLRQEPSKGNPPLKFTALQRLHALQFLEMFEELGIRRAFAGRIRVILKQRRNSLPTCHHLFTSRHPTSLEVGYGATIIRS